MAPMGKGDMRERERGAHLREHSNARAENGRPKATRITSTVQTANMYTLRNCGVVQAPLLQ